MGSTNNKQLKPSKPCDRIPQNAGSIGIAITTLVASVIFYDNIYDFKYNIYFN